MIAVFNFSPLAKVIAVTAGFSKVVGSTGSARGTKPHIHFGLSWSTPPQTWWVRRGMVWPWKYLDAWKAGKDLSPAKEVEAKRLKVGDLPPEPK